jgi:predicted negative regulator of RcsB-dependent stress response
LAGILSAIRVLAGAAVSGIWKVAAILLATALLLVASSTGTGWWLAAGDRDAARAALVLEQGVSGQLRASISEQNRAIDGMAKATLAAQERGAAARAAAAAKGKKYDAALAQLAGVRATTCDEAMPAIRLLLEGVR